ncbi:SMAD/FHA domain-containing protein [Backusella circina FSU 941]|nr:SMAD/FHA domain-containing protein [Backusella circina FSU 941]
MTWTVVLRGHSQTKTLELKNNKVKIGRQTSTKTIPTPLNGYFDSKVLSRVHAELWQDRSKVFIKDLKSSNGTFLNGVRLSNENEESVPTEIKTGDTIEFGIDIMNESDSTILYHKVECKVYLFHSPLAHINDPLFTSLQEPQKKKSGDSTALEILLHKLEKELEISKQIENELKVAKEKANHLDQELNQDDERKRSELEVKLKQAEQSITAFEERWMLQNQAIKSAKISLCQLEKENGAASEERTKLLSQLSQERARYNELKEQLTSLEKSSPFLNALKPNSLCIDHMFVDRRNNCHKKCHIEFYYRVSAVYLVYNRLSRVTLVIATILSIAVVIIGGWIADRLVVIGLGIVVAIRSISVAVIGGVHVIRVFLIAQPSLHLLESQSDKPDFTLLAL